MNSTPAVNISDDENHGGEPWPEIDWLNGSSPVNLPPQTGWFTAMKPTFDFLFAIAVAPFVFPVIGMCWLLIKATSRGPGFYSQVRSGLNGQPYKILKLRTMGHNVEAKTGIQWSQKGDNRVTKVGKFLRATHLDELPQIVNVLRGEMSFVGPRPERPEVIKAKGLANLVAGYEQRLNVKPGVTGFAQLQLTADSGIRSVKHKVAYDLYYIAHQSFSFDVRLIVATMMKTTGLSMKWLRRLFFLPARDTVGQVFRSFTHEKLSIKVGPDSTTYSTESA
jgi:lipopolysaccharide/colanic/teichoic acid biosynthesis glycosyltransferase